jgi:hypothetical protein
MADSFVVGNAFSVRLLVLFSTERISIRLSRIGFFLMFALGLFTTTRSLNARPGKRQTFWYGFFGLIVCLLNATAGLTLAAAPLPRTVLIIDEADPRGGGPTTFSATLRATLSKFRPRIAIFGETLDFSQFAGSTQESILRTYVEAKYSDVRFGLILAVGASAFDIVTRWRPELWPDVPIVFAAVDEVTAAALKRNRRCNSTVWRGLPQPFPGSQEIFICATARLVWRSAAADRRGIRCSAVSELRRQQ